nr:serine dehydratase subunit alpha family protein [Clostridia bacterium]
MKKNDTIYEQYIRILREELIPAMGCTEPISIAFAAAKARAVLGTLPDRIKVEASGNIIKNVKSVVVPHTGGLRGIQTAAAAGALAGDENAELEVLSHITEEEIKRVSDYLETTPIEVVYAETPHIFDIMVTAYAGPDSAFVRIADYHTNVVTVRKNDEILLEKELSDNTAEGLTDRSCLTIKGIVEF